MTYLQARLFGSAEFCTIHGPLKLPKSVRALLCFLLLYRNECHSREKLAETLWGDKPPKQAFSCLSTTLWRLRQALTPKQSVDPGMIQSTSVGELAISPDCECQVDANDFQYTATEILGRKRSDLSDGDLSRLETTITLYRGELLESCYDDWILRERVRMAHLYENSLEVLVSGYSLRSNLNRAIKYAHLLLNKDSLREDIHCALFDLYSRNGQRNLAIRQFERCCADLKEELGCGPLEETVQTYQGIMEGTIDHQLIQSMAPPNTPGSLRSMRTSIVSIQGQLKDLLTNIDRLIQK